LAKRRLDEILVARGFAPSAAKAAGLIMAGKVTVEGRVEAKAGTTVDERADVAVAAGPRYASRGGEKLAFALDRFGVDVEGKICLDVGAAAGGFTSCLLERGAAHVHAVDVGRGLLAWSLRNDRRVTVWENVNARLLDGRALTPAPTLLVADVSFINLWKILEPLVPTLAELQEIIALDRARRRCRGEREGVRRAGVRRRRRRGVAAAGAGRQPRVLTVGLTGRGGSRPRRRDRGRRRFREILTQTDETRFQRRFFNV
jgi:23S rRNA (cytidine1920-2'-O)/16S rRNA (cytidine1409-2'-O)-methyltransferase